MRVIIAEKPSVARDIANVLGCSDKKEGYILGDGAAVTWAFGHLVSIALPEEMNPNWTGPWQMERLPMIPERWRFCVGKEGAKQFNIIKRLFSEASEIVCATDAGREGEHIFRLIYQQSGCRKPFKRLWISSLTDQSIKAGFGALRDGTDFDPLADAAMCRAKADWLVGLNFTQAYTVHNNQLCTVGRVQTPTLALVVNREMEIKRFVKTLFYEIHAQIKEGFSAHYIDADGNRRIMDKAAAQAKLNALKQHKAAMVAVAEIEEKKVKPPALFNLLNLQKEANRLFGLTAEQTLKVAQALYEKHKAITYPRTESQHISTDMVDGLTDIITALPASYGPHKQAALDRLAGGLKLGKAYVNDNKLTDHHAVIPSGKTANVEALSEAEKNVFHLVCDHFISIFLPPCVQEQTKIFLGVGNDIFYASGTVTASPGWRDALSVKKVKADSQALPKLNEGDMVDIEEMDIKEKETKPPSRFNDASLLSAMKGAGKLVDDEDMAAIMKENGLGTPATRAAIIERLIKSGYLSRSKKVFIPTGKGINLIATVQEDLKSPALTGTWEQKLKGIEEGDTNAEAFSAEIEALVSTLLPQVARGKRVEVANLGQCPKCSQGRIVEGKKGFGCNRWKEGCDFVVWKKIAQKSISATQAAQLLAKKRTNVLKGFVSKKGKPFSAALVLNEEFKVVFEFPKTNKKGRAWS